MLAATSAISSGNSACRRLRPGSSSLRTSAEPRSSSSSRASFVGLGEARARKDSASAACFRLAYPRTGRGPRFTGAAVGFRAPLNTTALKWRAHALAVHVELRQQRGPVRRAHRERDALARELVLRQADAPARPRASAAGSRAGAGYAYAARRSRDDVGGQQPVAVEQRQRLRAATASAAAVTGRRGSAGTPAR